MERINPNDFSPKTTTAIQSTCAWPNLTLLPNGDIIAAIFNQPCHGLWEGELDAWASSDQGVSWHFRGRIAPIDAPGTNRMNCAAGLAKNNDIVVLCAGWTGRGPRGTRGKHHSECERLTMRVYRSSDSGKSFKPGSPETDLACPTYGPIVPFGDIHPSSDGRLLATAYAQRPNNGPYLVYLIASADDGHTWTIASVLNDKGNETALLPLQGTNLLAASREEHDNTIHQFTSPDNGRTWSRGTPLTLPGQVTAHLTRLKDGRLLLSHGNRCINNFGVDVRSSSDEGKTWSAPIRIADCPLRDCGYPATVQLQGGELLTAFYTQLPGYGQYEMRVTKWPLI